VHVFNLEAVFSSVGLDAKKGAIQAIAEAKKNGMAGFDVAWAFKEGFGVSPPAQRFLYYFKCVLIAHSEGDIIGERKFGLVFRAQNTPNVLSEHLVTFAETIGALPFSAKEVHSYLKEQGKHYAHGSIPWLLGSHPDLFVRLEGIWTTQRHKQTVERVISALAAEDFSSLVEQLKNCFNATTRKDLSQKSLIPYAFLQPHRHKKTPHRAYAAKLFLYLKKTPVGQRWALRST